VGCRQVQQLDAGRLWAAPRLWYARGRAQFAAAGGGLGLTIAHSCLGAVAPRPALSSFSPADTRLFVQASGPEPMTAKPPFKPPPLSDRGQQAVVDFARHALPALQARTPSRAVPVVWQHITVFADQQTGWHDEFPRHRSARTIPLGGGYTELLALPPVAEAVRGLWEEGQLPQPRYSDDAGRPITNLAFEQMLPQLAQLPLDAVYEYLDEFGTFTLDAGRLLAAFATVQGRHAVTHVDIRASAPLHGFDSALDAIALPDGVLIERMSGADKTSLWRDDYLVHAFTKLQFAECNFRLVFLQRRPKEHAHSSVDADPRFRDAVTALRLIKPGGVSAPATVLEEVPRPKIGGQSSGTAHRDRLAIRFFSGGTYRLEEPDVAPLGQVYGALRSMDGDPRMREFGVALRRFNLSYDRALGDDRIIDLTISLESSLLFGVREELKYRLALRGAALLRATARPLDAQGALLRLYDIRSGIVHNGQSLGEMKAKLFAGTLPHNYPFEVQHLVRSILGEYLRRLAAGGSLSSINEALDAQIVGGLAEAGVSGTPPEADAG